MYTVSLVITHELIESLLKTGAELSHCRISSGLPNNSVLKSSHVDEKRNLTLTFDTTESVGDVLTIEIECIRDKPQEDDIPF